MLGADILVARRLDVADAVAVAVVLAGLVLVLALRLTLCLDEVWQTLLTAAVEMTWRQTWLR